MKVNLQKMLSIGDAFKFAKDFLSALKLVRETKEFTGKAILEYTSEEGVTLKYIPRYSITISEGIHLVFALSASGRISLFAIRSPQIKQNIIEVSFYKGNIIKQSDYFDSSIPVGSLIWFIVETLALVTGKVFTVIDEEDERKIGLRFKDKTVWVMENGEIDIDKLKWALARALYETL